MAKALCSKYPNNMPDIMALAKAIINADILVHNAPYC